MEKQKKLIQIATKLQNLNYGKQSIVWIVTKQNNLTLHKTENSNSDKTQKNEVLIRRKLWKKHLNYNKWHIEKG